MILREHSYQTLDDEDIKGKWNDVIQDYLNKKTRIYRGMRGSGKLIHGDANGNRPAKNTHSFVNDAIDYLLPVWSDFPKRSESFICTTSPNTADIYGDVYLVIPLYNQDIGVCPSNDFWASFGNTIMVSSVTDAMYDIFKDANKKGLLPEIENGWKIRIEPNTLKKYIDIVDKNYSYDDFLEVPSQFDADTIKIIAGNDGIWSFLNTYLDPAEFKIEKLGAELPTNREVLVGGKVLFVSLNSLN